MSLSPKNLGHREAVHLAEDVLPLIPKGLGIKLLAQMAAPYAEQSAESISRRLFESRTGRAPHVSAHLTDSLLLALGNGTALHDLTILFPTKQLAEDATEAYCDVHEIDLPLRARRQLAAKLAAFSRGFLWEYKLALDAEREAEAAAA